MHSHGIGEGISVERRYGWGQATRADVDVVVTCTDRRDSTRRRSTKEVSVSWACHCSVDFVQLSELYSQSSLAFSYLIVPQPSFFLVNHTQVIRLLRKSFELFLQNQRLKSVCMGLVEELDF